MDLANLPAGKRLDSQRDDQTDVSVCTTQLKYMGKLLVNAKIPIPKTKEDEQAVQNAIQFAYSLSPIQQTLIQRLLCTEEHTLDDGETLISEVASEDTDEDYEPSFIDDASSVFTDVYNQ